MENHDETLDTSARNLLRGYVAQHHGRRPTSNPIFGDCPTIGELFRPCYGRSRRTGTRGRGNNLCDLQG